MKHCLSILLLLFVVFFFVGCNNDVVQPEPKVETYHTVKFDSAGGSTVSSVTVPEGEKVARPVSPTKTGFTFADWYNGTNKYDFSLAVTSDITLTAKWNVNVHTVTYINLNPNATGRVPDTSRYEYNSDVTVPGNIGYLTDTDNPWLEWNTKPNGTGTSYKGNEHFNITEDISLYAVWKNYNAISSPCTVVSSFSDATKLETVFNFDPRWFIGDNHKDNKNYDRDICILISLLASDFSHEVKTVVKHLESPSKLESDSQSLYKALGFDVMTECTLSGYNEDKNDVAHLIICHKKYGNNSLIILNIDGTDGSLTQWKSNIDVGADNEEYEVLEGQSQNWKNKARHKGFAVTAAKVKSIADDYIKELRNAGTQTVSLIITGHSRGAAIANIVGADYESEAEANNLIPFTYTFAAPNTTTNALNEKKETYKTVFNIVNNDDLVTEIPTTSDTNGTFTKYGETKKVDFTQGEGASNYKNMIGFRYEKSNLAEWLYLVKDICTSREDVYKMKKLKSSVSISDVSDWFSDRGLSKYYKAEKNKMTEMAPALIYNALPHLIASSSSLSEYTSLLNFARNLGYPYSSAVEAYYKGKVNTDGVVFAHEPITYIVAAHSL